MTGLERSTGRAIASVAAGFERPTRRESLQCLSILAASFPGRIPEETARVWSRKIEWMNANAADVLRACETIAAADERPTLSRLVAAIRAHAANRRSLDVDVEALARFRARSGGDLSWACRHADAPGEVCGACR